MKEKVIISSIALFAAASVASATSITLAGGPAPANVPGFFGLDGTPLDGSMISVGTFDVGTSVFTQFVGTNDTLAIQTLFAGNAALEAEGQGTGTVTQNGDAAVAFNGQQIFIQVDTGASIGVFSSDVAAPPTGQGDPFVFPANAGGVGDAATISVTQVNQAFLGGTIGADGSLIVAVPEPSTSLLLGLSALGLIVRRKR